MKIEVGDIVEDISGMGNHIGLVVRIDGCKIWCRWSKSIEEVKSNNNLNVLWSEAFYLRLKEKGVRYIKPYGIVEWLKKYA